MLAFFKLMKYDNNKKRMPKNVKLNIMNRNAKSIGTSVFKYNYRK